MGLLEEYKKYNEEFGYYSHATALLNWDMSTLAPEGAKERIANALTFFSTKSYEKATSEEFYKLVSALNEKEEFDKLDDVYKYDVKKTLENLDKLRRVPADFYEQYIRTLNNSSIIWPKAKQTNDFSIYAQPLKDTIEAVKKYESYEEPDKNVYDALIDKYEKGMTTQTIDRVFGELREELVPLLEKILKKPQPDHEKFTMFVPKHKQEELCTFLVKYMGMDMDRFCMGESEHPFTTNMNRDDVRFSNHYHENEFISAVYSAIHEGGHALFEQNVDKKYDQTCGGSIDLMGLHESQSRFFENIIGRNENFWKPIWPKMLEIVPELSSVTLEEFVKEINHVKNSYIRTEADELTYCLHVILRYEIERAIFFENVDVNDLPKMWDDKMEELLHLRPTTMTEGILQDMHWSDGSFGYFPTYLLGSIYDGMFLEAMEKDLGSIDDILAAGDISKITSWLKDKIHQYGSTRTSAEVIEAVCGKELSAAPLIKYFKEKYTKIYEL